VSDKAAARGRGSRVNNTGKVQDPATRPAGTGLAAASVLGPVLRPGRTTGSVFRQRQGVPPTVCAPGRGDPAAGGREDVVVPLLSPKRLATRGANEAKADRASRRGFPHGGTANGVPPAPSPWRPANWANLHGSGQSLGEHSSSCQAASAKFMRLTQVSPFCQLPDRDALKISPFPRNRRGKKGSQCGVLALRGGGRPWHGHFCPGGAAC
jgi:hypothetical protein